MRDRIYADAPGHPGPFAFTSEVAEVFADMLTRSVPGYGDTLRLIRLIADQVVTPDSTIYDLGCSLGDASLQIVDQMGDRAVIEAVDNAPAMIDRLTERLGDAPSPIRPRCMDIREVTFADASLTILNFTLQFIPLPDRAPLLERIAQATRPGGALVLSEKIRFDDPQSQDHFTQLHEAFKKANGYSELEVSRKRTALENVLIPETLEAHRQRLLEAGFSRCTLWFQCFNFVSLLAVK